MYNETIWPWGEPAAISPTPFAIDTKIAEPKERPCDATRATPEKVAPRKGTWFDEAIDLRDPEGDAITRKVLQLINAVEGRKRQLSQNSLDNRHTRIRKLLANGIRCHLHRATSLVAYFRKADSYQDKPQWLSGEAMAKTVDLLTKAELVRVQNGFRGTSSTYQVTERLAAIAKECGISESSLIIRLPPERLIRLYSHKPERELERFDPTPGTLSWTAMLEAYNNFIGEQDIAIELTEEEKQYCVAHLNDQLEKRERQDGKGGLSYIRPELFRTDLSRVFNNSSFEQGGRLYGGWWISMPKKLRQKITINGQPTIELDYSGCAIRMLYHEKGIDYRDDPYFLGPITALAKEKGLAEDQYRPAIKAILQAAINEDDPTKKPWLIPLDGISFQPEYKREEIYAMLMKKHELISDAFRTGAGLRLQKLESDIVLDIITSLKDRGVPALPIHDSVMVAKERLLSLSKAMNDNYLQQCGFQPIITGS